MPYIIRDSQGQITRATTQPIYGAEGVPYAHPELLSFLTNHGQDPKTVDDALSELRRTDAEMSRAVEDVIMALLKKNILKLTDLPKPVQERIAYRVKLRTMIQEAFDRASDVNANNQFAASAHKEPGGY